MIKLIIVITLLIVAGIDIYISSYTEGYGDGIADGMNIVNDALKKHGIIQRHEIMNEAIIEINKEISKKWKIK